MSVLSRLINLIQQPWLHRVVIISAACWLAVGLVCCVFGAMGLYVIGRRVEQKPYFPAFFPGGQVQYTLLLAKEEQRAQRAELLMWWCPVLVVAGGAGIVWAAYYYVTGNALRLYTSLVLAVLLLAVALVFYICVRVLELRGLLPILKRWEWILSLIGTVFGVPIQRILLFSERNNILKE